MKKSKLIELFNRLSNKEIKDFSLFVRSPYFNRRQEVVDLFDYLEKHRELAEGFYTKEKAWKFLFPGKAYDDSKMRYCMSFLFQTLKEYCIYTELKKEKIYTQILACRSYRQKGITKLFENEIEKATVNQQKSEHRNSQYHFYNYLLHTEREKAYPLKQLRSKDPLIQKSIDELTIFYISDILRQSCSALSAQAIMKKDYKLSLLKEILNHVEENDYSAFPEIEIYFYGYKALSDHSDKLSLSKLKDLVENNWAMFPKDESRSLYLLAINCCIKRANKGEKKYLNESFDLYKSGIQNGSLLENDEISTFTYTNASRIGLALKKFDWVDEFIHNYQNYLPASERENIFNYNLACFYFQKPDYDKAMDLLQKVEFKDTLNNLDSRRMLLRIYYEKGYSDALDSLLDSFKAYLNRQKQISYHKESYAKLIYFVKKVQRSNLIDKTIRTKLINEIQSTQAFAERSWLLEQLQSPA